MARMFSSQEREEIRRTLVEKGRALFARSGLKRTSVEELTRAAGISAGSFYSFFGSKEELFFDILEQEEAHRDNELEKFLSGGNLTQENFADFLEQVFVSMEASPILRQLYEDGAYEQLLRKLPPERVESHIEKDSEAFKQLLAVWQREGYVLDEDLEVLAGLFRGLFFITLHRHEVGEAVYPRVRRLLLRFVAEGLVLDHNRKPQNPPQRPVDRQRERR